MTGSLQPDAGTSVVIADGTSAGVLSQVIADAFADLAVSRWLIPDQAARHRIFPDYFRLYVEHALADGIVCTTPGQDAVALWLPAGEEPAPPSEGYDERLAALTGPWIDRFRAFDQALEVRHPTGFAYRRVAPVHCCTGAPSGPCMRVVLAHGPSKPLRAVRVQCHDRVLPARRRAGCCSRRQVACTRCVRVSFPAAG
jgi:hypothetical protein